MGQFGRLTSVDDLPGDQELLRLVREAVRLNDQGIKVPEAAKAPRPAIKPPKDFMAAVLKNEKALATFESFSPTNRRDYREWITEARSEETRNRRLETAVGWMAEGKPRNWKYMKKSV